MCGIAGFWTGESDLGKSNNLAVLSAMADAIAHRGPDAEGVWQDKSSGVGLAHRRLSVIDLSEAGAQPMLSSSGRYVLVYNGEIYNHRELRVELESSVNAPSWRGRSDTETLLATIEAVGIEVALSKTCGMFSLALWDCADQSLTLARDRIGEKPLYYGTCGNTLLFGSELKALKAHPAFESVVDRASVGAYLQFGYVPYPHSIYKGIKKLPPGHMISFCNQNEVAVSKAWWSLESASTHYMEGAGTDSFEVLVRSTEATLLEVVDSQMISDVPLGVFLSGGIDSSLVAALMCKTSRGSVHSFSIGFGESRFNEAEHAKAVARHLGTKHTEFLVNTKDVLGLIDRLPHIYDEPFSDSSQLPTILLSKLARQHVTVALTGDGGDEMFGGYNRHVSGPTLWKWIRRVPAPIKAAGATLAANLQSSMTGGRAELSSRLAVRFGFPVTAVDRLGKFASAARQSVDSNSFYRNIVCIFSEPSAWMVEPTQAKSILDTFHVSDRKFTLAEQWMMLDTLSYLPDDILVKVDRASMSMSLETRAPFLDKRIIEAAWKLPISSKISDGRGKRILREVLWRHVPQALVERPKQGFAIPIDEWLRGDLKEWADDMLSPSSIRECGLLRPSMVGSLWEDHCAGRVNAGQQLWTILMLQVWMYENILPDTLVRH